MEAHQRTCRGTGLGGLVSFLDASSGTALPRGASVSVAKWPGYAAIAVTVAAAGLLAWPFGTWGYAAGYVLGAVVGPVMAVAHRYSFERCQKDPWFVRSLMPGRIIMAAVGAGLAVGLFHAWLLATELAKR